MSFQNGGPQNESCGRWLAGPGQPHECVRFGHMSTGYPEEWTRLDDRPIYPATTLDLGLKHLRRFRRVPLTHVLVNSFIHKYCYALDNSENCFRYGCRQKRVMREILTKQFLPWTRNNLVECLDESRWPLEMILFEALDDLLPDKFPKIYWGSCWQAIAQCYRRLREAQQEMDSS